MIMLVVLTVYLLEVQYELLMYCQYEVVEQEDFHILIDDDEVEAEMLYKQLLKQTYEIVIVFVYDNEVENVHNIIIEMTGMDEKLNLIIQQLFDDELDDIYHVLELVIFGLQVYDVLEQVDEVVYQLLLNAVDVRYLDEELYENDVIDEIQYALEVEVDDDLEVLDVTDIVVAEVMDETEYHQTLVEKLLSTDDDEQVELECIEYDELDDEVEVMDEIVDVVDVLEVIDEEDDELDIDIVDETEETEQQ